jgi:hypothetical protein
MACLCSGNPLFLEPHWRRHTTGSAVVFSSPDGTTELRHHRQSLPVCQAENHIRQLHRAVGNAVADDKHVVFSAGSMQPINGLVHALSPDANAVALAARVVSAVPCYGVSPT